MLANIAMLNYKINSMGSKYLQYRSYTEARQLYRILKMKKIIEKHESLSYDHGITFVSLF